VLRIFDNSELPNCDLIVDAVYEGANGANLASEPLSVLLPGVGNQGEFRAAGRSGDKKFAVLYSTCEDRDCAGRCADGDPAWATALLLF
jgi:hypothetical protein